MATKNFHVTNPNKIVFAFHEHNDFQDVAGSIAYDLEQEFGNNQRFQNSFYQTLGEADPQALPSYPSSGICDISFSVSYVLNKGSDDEEEVTLYCNFIVVLRSGYYEGANADYYEDRNIESDFLGAIELSEGYDYYDLVNELCDERDITEKEKEKLEKAFDSFIEVEILERSNCINNILNSGSDQQLKTVGVFSDGSAVYESMKQ